jgi:rhodanese-related sulfurtransferase
MKEISVEEFKVRLEQGEQLTVIDVREEWEFLEYNIGAINIPLSALMARMDELEELKDKEVILHCRTGVRSAKATLFLEQMGYRNVKNLVGGIEAFRRLL